MAVIILALFALPNSPGEKLQKKFYTARLFRGIDWHFLIGHIFLAFFSLFALGSEFASNIPSSAAAAFSYWLSDYWLCLLFDTL